MTTIATDGRVVAFDSRMTYGSLTVVRAEPKVVRVSDHGYCGASGGTSECAAFIQWIRAQLLPGPKATEPALSDEFEGILVDVSTGKVFLYRKHLKAIQMPAPFAIGSGAEFAIGAMAAGATAVEAVRICCKLSATTGEPVHCLPAEAAAMSKPAPRDLGLEHTSTLDLLYSLHKFAHAAVEMAEEGVNGDTGATIWRLPTITDERYIHTKTLLTRAGAVLGIAPDAAAERDKS